MADNINIPQDLTDVVEITVKDKSKALRDFLITLANKISTLEETVKEQEARITELENA